MSNQAKATFSVQSWKEEPFSTCGNAKLTVAQVVYRYAGDVEGEGVVAYIMRYDDDGVARCRAWERFTGSIAGRQGTLVFEHEAWARGSDVKGLVTVVEGSGTGELAGLRGGATIDIGGHQERYPFLLSWS